MRCVQTTPLGGMTRSVQRSRSGVLGCPWQFLTRLLRRPRSLISDHPAGRPEPRQEGPVGRKVLGGRATLQITTRDTGGNRKVLTRIVQIPAASG